jgi:hypothetical protein
MKLLAILLHFVGLVVLGGLFFLTTFCGFSSPNDSFHYLTTCRIMPWAIITLFIVNLVMIAIIPFLSLSSKAIFKYILLYLVIMVLFILFFIWVGEDFKLPFIDMLWRQRVY